MQNFFITSNFKLILKPLEGFVRAERCQKEIVSLAEQEVIRVY